MADTLSGAPGESDLEGFQVDAARQTLSTLSGGDDATLIAPTGAGKTAMMLTVAQGFSDRERAGGGEGRVLLLTHRQRLVDQIMDREAKIWARDPVGHIAAHRKEGEVDQNPRLVVGMVQSAAARLDQLKGYDLVMIDECHHMYDPQSQPDGEISDYEKVVRAIGEQHGDPRLLGATATDFRAQGELHPRLREAPNHTVTFQDALSAGRIVPPRTEEMDYRLADGSRAQEFLDATLAQSRSRDLAESVGSELKRARGQTPDELAAFSDQVVAGWKQKAEGIKTLGFQDSIKEMQALAGAFERAGVKVATMHSGQSARENARVSEAFGRPDGPDVLLSVGMIGEGYDVPEAGCTMIANGCPPRAWYAQMIGRSMRAADGKDAAMVLDFGAGSRMWGRMEDQVELQQEQRRLQTTRGLIGRRRALEDVVARPDPGLPVIGFAGRTGNAFAVEMGGGRVQAFWQDREPVRDGKHQRNSSAAVRMPLDSDGKKSATLNAFHDFVAEQLEENPGWHGRNRRLTDRGERHDHEMLAQGYKSVADVLRPTARGVREMRVQTTGRADSLDTPQDRAATALAETRAAAERKPGPAREVTGRLAVDLSGNPEAARRESVFLAGLVAGEMAEHTRGGVRQGLRAVSARVVTDLGMNGLSAQDARNPKAIPSMAGYTAKVFQGAARGFAETGNTGLSALATKWSQHCWAVAQQAREASHVKTAAPAQRSSTRASER